MRYCFSLYDKKRPRKFNLSIHFPSKSIYYVNTGMTPGLQTIFRVVKDMFRGMEASFHVVECRFHVEKLFWQYVPQGYAILPSALCNTFLRLMQYVLQGHAILHSMSRNTFLRFMQRILPACATFCLALCDCMLMPFRYGVPASAIEYSIVSNG